MRNSIELIIAAEGDRADMHHYCFIELYIYVHINTYIYILRN